MKMIGFSFGRCSTGSFLSSFNRFSYFIGFSCFLLLLFYNIRALASKGGQGAGPPAKILAPTSLIHQIHAKFGVNIGQLLLVNNFVLHSITNVM